LSFSPFELQKEWLNELQHVLIKPIRLLSEVLDFADRIQALGHLDHLE
jgi:hypothetical protein